MGAPHKMCKTLFTISTLQILISVGFAQSVSIDASTEATTLNINESNPAAEQLLEYAETHPVPSIVTTSYGTPVDDLLDALTAGPRGPLLLQDTTYIDITQSMNRERIPERVVHAKGAGAFGTLTITGDITKYSSASMFQPGTTWNLTTRFSRISGEMGSQDTRRDTRGFAVKFYTDRGIWDLVSNNSPIFFIRDPMLFIQLVHSIMRNPQTHLLDPSAMWDFFSRTPQTIPQLLVQFSDYGIPLSYRHMDGFSIHALTLVNLSGDISFAKFRWRSNQGVKFLSNEQANSLASSNPDFYIEDLYNAIASGNYPSWNLTAQILSPQQVAEIPFYPFDATKDWNTTTYPEVEVGIMTLNQNPQNYFVDAETVGFDPGRLVPGIQPTVDRLLQGRMFAYTDAQVYRVGVNGNNLLRNRAMNAVNNYLRDGPGDYGNNQGDAVNYYPNSFNGPVTSPENKLASYHVTGSAGRFSTANDDNYSQGTAFYENVLSPDQRTRLINNLADSISSAYPFIQMRSLKVLCNIGADLCERLAAALKIDQESPLASTSTTGSEMTTLNF